MSHEWDCPTEYEARRQGELAGRRGKFYWSNPYEDNGINERPCEEAAEEWERGRRRGAAIRAREAEEASR